MNITIFNGSPWSEAGHTHIMAQEFALGAAKQGAKIQTVYLVTKNIQPCNECGACFFKTPGKCVLKDDMSGLISKFMASDVVVLATPLFIDNVTAIMKIFIDRLLPILEPHYEKDSDGEYRRRPRFRKYPKLVVVSSCAMPQQSNFQVLKLFFRRMARTMHTEVIGEIYCSAAGLLLLVRKELRFRTMVDEYKKLLYAGGRELVKTGRVSSEMQAKLQEPMIGADEYVQYANRMWDQLLAEHGLKKVLA